LTRQRLIKRLCKLTLGNLGDVAPFGKVFGGLSMNRKIKASELPEFDAAEYLGSDEDIAAYLTTVLEENDASLLAAALGDIARARGMTQVAKDSGITREALYKALRPGSAPRFDTVSKVCAALGVRLVAQPASATVE
jgi:probable addiction module antidote protein